MVEVEQFAGELSSLYGKRGGKPPKKSPISAEMRSLRKDIGEIERDVSAGVFGNPPKISNPIKKKVPRNGQWQEYLKPCLSRVNKNKENSPFAIEIVTGAEFDRTDGKVKVNEVMRACATEWHNNYRDEENPRQAFENDLELKKAKRCQSGDC